LQNEVAKLQLELASLKNLIADVRLALAAGERDRGTFDPSASSALRAPRELN
jgi:hypothetical protein